MTRSHVRSSSLIGAMILWAAPVAAQDTNSRIEQIPASAAPDAGSQTTGRDALRRAIAAPQHGDGAAPAAPQIGSPDQSRARGTQLTVEPRGARAPEQLYRGGKTAQPTEALSRPSEGRMAAVSRVGGDDRCDRPQTDPAIVRACARAIETRAAEYQRREAPVLSPEQRLLADQRLREAPMNARNAARRLATEGDADSLDGQGVASIALRRDSTPARPAVPAELGQALSPEAQAVINALIGTITGTPPAPPPPQ